MSKGAKVYVRYKLHLIDFTCEGSSLSAVCEVGAISFLKAQLLGCGNFHRFLVAFMFLWSIGSIWVLTTQRSIGRQLLIVSLLDSGY